MPFVTTTPTSRIPDVYYQPVAAPKNIAPVASDIVAIVGEATRGALDAPTYVGSPTEFRARFGGMADSAASPGTPLSLYPSYLGVKQQGTADIIAVRVAGSRCASGYVTLLDASSGAVCVLHAATPGTWAAGLSAVVRAGAATGTVDLVVTNNATNERDVITGLASGDNAALIARINAQATLVVASAPVVDAPGSSTFTPAATSGGTLSVGAYKVLVTWTTANGETTASAEYSVTTTSSNKTIGIPWVADSGGHATGYKAYLTAASGASGTETFAASGTSSSPISISAPPAASTVTPPVRNAATFGAGTSLALAAGTFVVPSTAGTGAAPGHDGAGSSAARHVGVAGAPSTGLYTLASLDPRPDFVFLAEAAGADTTQWSAQAQAASDYNWIACVCYPAGTTDAGALTAKLAQSSLGAGANGPRIKDAWPWLRYYDAEVYNAVISLAPHSVLAGLSAVQDPNTSAANKPATGYLGPEFSIPRSVGGSGGIEALIAARVNVMSASIPSSGIGLVTDLMFNGDDGFVTRMTALLAEGFLRRGAQYLERPNTPQLRAQAQLDTRSFLDRLAGLGLIPQNPAGGGITGASPAAAGSGAQHPGSALGIRPSTQTSAGAPLGYAVVCDDSNNLVNGLATNLLTIDVQVQLFPNTSQVLFRVQAGTTVTVTLQPSS